MHRLRAEKPVFFPNLTCVRGDRGCRNPIAGDVAETRGFASSVPKAKKVIRLATRDTLHGSRPNLRQRELDGRIVPTPPDVSGKGASKKRCARRESKNHNYIYTYTRYLVFFMWKSQRCGFMVPKNCHLMLSLFLSSNRIARHTSPAFPLVTKYVRACDGRRSNLNMRSSSFSVH